MAPFLSVGKQRYCSKRCTRRVLDRKLVDDRRRRRIEELAAKNQPFIPRPRRAEA